MEANAIAETFLSILILVLVKRPNRSCDQVGILFGAISSLKDDFRDLILALTLIPDSNYYFTNSIWPRSEAMTKTQSLALTLAPFCSKNLAILM